MQNLAAIKKISGLMRALSGLSLLLVLGTWIWMGLMLDAWIPSVARQTGLQINLDGIGLMQHSLVILILLIPFGIAAYGLWRLQALFGLYARGLFFTEPNIKALQSFAGTLVASALASPLVSAFLSILLTWNNPPGQRALHISFGSQQGLLLLIGGTLWVITWIMCEAKKLADENAEFI